MTKRRILFYCLTIIIVSTSLVMFHKKFKQNEVCFRNYCFSVELAQTKLSQAKGLMFRREMGEDQGMLFVFQEEAPRSFWMKNTFLPLDIVFLNKNKEVVAIEKNLQPCEGDTCPSISSQEKAQYVLELCANIADKINLKMGDKLDFKN